MSLLDTWKRLLAKEQIPTQLRVEAAKVRLKLGEATRHSFHEDEIHLEAIEDRDGVVFLEKDY